MTSPGHAGCPHRSSPAPPTDDRATSTPSEQQASPWWAESSASPAVDCSARALTNLTANADLKQNRFLDRIDAYAAEAGLDDVAPERPAPTTPGTPATDVDLAGVGTIVWATGYRPAYPWLDSAVLDRRGQIIHDGGVMPVPGLYVVGLPLLRRRKSSFLDGIGADAVDVTAHVREHLERNAAAA